MISSLQRSSAATTGCCRSVPVRLRSATPRRSTSRQERADGPIRVSALTAGSPIATLSASAAPSPWPTIPVRRRSSCGWPRMADSMSRASSIRVKSDAASQAPSEAPQPRGSTRRLATPCVGQRVGQARQQAARRPSAAGREPGGVAAPVPGAVSVARQPRGEQQDVRVATAGVGRRTVGQEQACPPGLPRRPGPPAPRSAPCGRAYANPAASAGSLQPATTPTADRSLMIWPAASRPGAPITQPPGCVPEPHW